MLMRSLADAIEAGRWRTRTAGVRRREESWILCGRRRCRLRPHDAQFRKSQAVDHAHSQCDLILTDVTALLA